MSIVSAYATSGSGHTAAPEGRPPQERRVEPAAPPLAVIRGQVVLVVVDGAGREVLQPREQVLFASVHRHPDIRPGFVFHVGGEPTRVSVPPRRIQSQPRAKVRGQARNGND
jgi:hypothetical protein